MFAALLVLPSVANAAPAKSTKRAASASLVYQLQLKPQSRLSDLRGWKFDSGDFEVRDQWLTITSDRSNPVATLRTNLQGDGTVRGTVRGGALSHRVTFGIEGAYLLELNKQLGQIILNRWNGSDWASVGSFEKYLDYTRRRDRFELRLVFAGQRVLAFVDDKLLISFDDPQPLPHNGALTLGGGWETRVAWRDIRISRTPDLSEWPVEQLPEPVSPDLVEVTWVRVDSPDNIYFDQQKASLNLKLISRQRAKLHAAFRLVDVRQAVVAEQTRQLDLTSGTAQGVELTFAPPARGCFKVALFAGTDPKQLHWVEDVGSFVVVNPQLAQQKRDPQSPFGGHIDGINLEWHAAAARKLGVDWVRCHDMLQYTWWNVVQPESASQWRWGDDEQRLVDAAGLSTLGVFLWTPPWATSPPGKENTTPPRLPAFSNYVEQSIKHYPESIRTWEVWNEPYFGGFWSGSPQEYVRLLKSAWTAAKRADANVKVIGGGGASFEQFGWTAEMIGQLDGKTMDAFSVHYIWPEDLTQQIAGLRKLLKQHGNDVPIWDTEESVVTTSFLDQLRRSKAEPEARYHFRNACYELVHTYCECLANGVVRMFYYDLADPWRFGEHAKPRVLPDELSHSMWDEGQMLRPIAAAHAALVDQLAGKKFDKRVDKQQLRAFVFSEPNEAVAVLYGEFANFSDELRLLLDLGDRSADIRVVDFMDNELPKVATGKPLEITLSREPVYLRCRGQDAAATLLNILEAAKIAGKK